MIMAFFAIIILLNWQFDTNKNTNKIHLRPAYNDSALGVL